MKIKVCGNTVAHQVEELSALGVDYAGLIFFDQSPRYVLEQLTGTQIQAMDLSLEKAGVFVNATEEAIMAQVRDFGLDLVQLQGDETPTFCNRISDHVKVIKAFRIGEPDTNVDWLVKEYEEVCDYYLFDKGSEGLYGGTGQQFNWNQLSRAAIGKPFFLSGGIGPGDVQAIQDFAHPYLFGVDVNSKFEQSPGIKDMDLVTEFVHRLKS